MRQIRNLKKWVEAFENICQKQEDLTVLLEFQRAGEITVAEVEDHYNQTLIQLEEIEFLNMLSNEGDDLSAVLQITAGAGGTESVIGRNVNAHVFGGLRKTKSSQRTCNQLGDVENKNCNLRIKRSMRFWLA